jgi:hypothetical protein
MYPQLTLEQQVRTLERTAAFLKREAAPKPSSAESVELEVVERTA